MTITYTLNAMGHHYVKEFIRLYGNDGLPEEPYFSAAEEAANACLPEETIPVLRLAIHDTYDNTPRSLMLDEAWFDAHDPEAPEASDQDEGEA